MRRFTHYGKVLLGRDTFVGEHCTLSFPREEKIRRLKANRRVLQRQTEAVSLGDGCVVCNHVCIYEGTTVGARSFIEDHVRIGYNCTIGSDARVLYGAYICDRAEIGADTRIAGFICDGAKVGSHSTVMGNLVHEYTSPDCGWWDVDEEAPVVHDHSIVGFNATIVGGVRVGPYAYVAAGAIVTKNVPRNHIACSINDIVPLRKWKGRKLDLMFHRWLKA